MKRLFKFLAILFFLFSLGYIALLGYVTTGSSEPDNTVWTAFIGRDTTVGILPDAYANYFTYTVARPNKNVGYRIKGAFPSTRYMSFNVYNLEDNATQGSLVDYQVDSDSGLPNPFVGNPDSTAIGKNYTVNIIPDSYKDAFSKNSLTFDRDSRLLLMVIRLYDFNKDDFGGVDYPTVEAFSLGENLDTRTLKTVNLPRNLDLRAIVRRVGLPKMVERLGHLYETETAAALDAANNQDQRYQNVPFHGLDASGFIENNDNRYLMAALTKKEEEVFVFRLKAPTYTTGFEDINQTDVRYWSFNLGNAATYNFNAIKDEDAILDEEGFAHIVLADDDPAIRARTKTLGFNFLEWNMPWQKGFILFRHMLANPAFEAQIEAVPQFAKGAKELGKIEAHHTMGDYAPRGVRMSKSDFLKEYAISTE